MSLASPARESAALFLACRLFLGVPIALMVLAYVMLCVTYGTAFPWLIPVHEDGIRTLPRTIFYFEHAMRELPIDILLGVGAGAAVASALPRRADGPGRGVLLAVSLGLVAIIAIGTVADVGVEGLWLNLIQSHTRPGAELVTGSHWFYHLFCRPTLILAAIAVGLLLGGLTGTLRRPPLAVAVATLGLFAAVTVAIPSWPSLLWLSATDPVYLGHQARELLTHGAVTLPLALGLSLWAADRTAAAARPHPGALVAGGLLLAVALGITAMVGVLALSADSLSMGQSEDINVLIWPHFFEHVFTYLVSSAVAALTFTVLAGTSRHAPAR